MSAKRLLQLVSLLVILATVLGACAPAPAPAQPTAAPVEQPTEAPAAAPAAGEKPLIAGVVFQCDTFMQTVQAGMQAAADKVGVEMILGNTETSWTKKPA